MPKDDSDAARSLRYWQAMADNPEENARICAGLKKGFDDHYWRLRAASQPAASSDDGSNDSGRR